MIPCLIALTLAAAIDGPTVGPEEFVRLIQGQYEGIRDLQVLAEGEERYVGDNREYAREFPQIAGPNTYQGLYATRSDGATLTDIYYRGPGADGSERPFTRETNTFFRGFVEKLGVTPDLKQVSFNRREMAAPAAFNAKGSYGRIFFFWYLRSLKDPVKAGYHQTGWEEVDGQRCLVVEFAYYENLQRDGDPVLRFWVDLGRGGHPLRYEYVEGGKAIFRSDRIVLGRFPSVDDKEFWVPVSGQSTFYGRGKDYASSGLFRETYSVVTGTVRINAGLPDAIFSARYAGGLDGTDEMKRLRKVSLNVPKADAPRADRAGVEKNLSTLLSEADAQSKRLEASSAASEVSAWTPILQFGLVVVGATLLGGIFYYKRKVG